MSPDRHGRRTPSLEKHHWEVLSGNHITNDQLGDDVQTKLVGGNGLNDTDGDRQGKGYMKAESILPEKPREPTYIIRPL